MQPRLSRSSEDRIRPSGNPRLATRAHAGLTLIELLLALSITAIIAAVVATLSLSLSTAYREQDNYQQAIQDGRGTIGRIQAVTRKAKLVTAVSDDTIVYWIGDSNGDGAINRDELAMFQYDSVAKKVLQCRIVLGPSDSNSVRQLSEVTAPAAAAALLASDACRQWDVLAENVQEFQATASPAAPKAGSIAVSMKVGQGGQTLALTNMTLLRANVTDSVGLSGGLWVLGQ